MTSRLLGGVLRLFMPKTTDEQLEQQVRKDLKFLFSGYEAKVVLNFYDRKHFGNAYIDLEIAGLYIKIVRDRGDITGYISSPSYKGQNTRWVWIGTAIRALQMQGAGDPVPEAPTYKDLAAMGKLLEPLLPGLQEAFSKANCEHTFLRILRISEVERDRFLARFAESSAARAN